MTKLKLLVEFEYDEEAMYDDDPELIAWFFDLLKNQTHSLHNNDIGDFIGEIKVLEIE